MIEHSSVSTPLKPDIVFVKPESDDIGDDEQTSSGYSESLDSHEDRNNLQFEYLNFSSKQDMQLSETIFKDSYTSSYITADRFEDLSTYIYSIPYEFDISKNNSKIVNIPNGKTNSHLENNCPMFKESRASERDVHDDEFYFDDCMTCGNSVNFNLSDYDEVLTSDDNKNDLIKSISKDSSENGIVHESRNPESTPFYGFKGIEEEEEEINVDEILPLVPNNVRSRSCLIDYRSYKRTPFTRVTFADSKGFALEDVRYLTPPNDYLSPMMIIESVNNKVETLIRQSRPRRILTPLFDQPNVSPLFTERLMKATVLLEYAFSNCLSLYGSVIVRNLQYEKNIFVRYTIDNWKTSKDLKASYSFHHDDNDTDSFSFYYNFTMWTANLKRIEFAVCYKATNGKEIWDNNNGKNYVFICKYS